MKILTWQNPEQLFVAQELINKVKSKCCGIKVLDIFSPAHYKEFQRLLSPNGYVVKVIPTKNHLREIRTKVQAHLKNPDYSNESVVEYFEKYLKTISRETVSATVQLSSEQRMSFIEMTPLLFCVEKDCVDWRTLTHLTIEADVLIGMY